MAENKNTIVVYADWISQFEDLTDEEAGKLIKHFFRYINDLNPVSDRLTELLFTPIKQSLKRDLMKWEQKKVGRSDSGRLGNLKRWNSDLYDKVIANELTIEDAENIANNRKQSHSDYLRQKESQIIANIAVTDTVSVTVNDILLEKETKENPLFESFWNAYDKKVEKVKCEIKFNKLAKKDIEKIFEALPIYIKSTPDIQFRKNPLTWLNGKCWNDELSVAPESKPKPIYTMASPIL